VPFNLYFTTFVAAGSLAEDPAMVCSYTQMEHDPAHTWHAAQGPFQEPLRERKAFHFLTRNTRNAVEHIDFKDIPVLSKWSAVRLGQAGTTFI